MGCFSSTEKSKVFVIFWLFESLVIQMPARAILDGRETSQQVDMLALSSANWQTTQAFISQQLFCSCLNKILGLKRNSWVPTLCYSIHWNNFFFSSWCNFIPSGVQQEHGLTSMQKKKNPAWRDEKLFMMAWVMSAWKREGFVLFVCCSCRSKYILRVLLKLTILINWLL